MGKLWRDGPLLIPDWVNARYWFTQAANQGFVTAQYSLAKLYLSDDVEVRDIELGIKWLKTAAENGNDYAMYRLAKEYIKGENIEKDTAQAVEWFTKSAERGNQYAQYMLGKLYLIGNDIPQDYEQALHWLTQSAEQGNSHAEYFINHIQENRSPSVMLSVTRLLYHIGRIFEDNSIPQSHPEGIHIDHKLLEKLREKQLALGIKSSGHDRSGPKMSM